MKKKNSYGMNTARALNGARKLLGLGQVSKNIVFEKAAARLGVSLPCLKRDRYRMLRKLFPDGMVPQKEKSRPEKKKERFEVSDDFLSSFEWRKLRMVVLKKRGAQCECCGAKAPDVRINVDHVKPRRRYPELALEESNLQVLCNACNHGKGSWDETDWRKDRPEVATVPEVDDSPFSQNMRPRLVKTYSDAIPF